MGASTKLTPEAHKAVVDARRAGATYEIAAAHALVETSTVHKWITRGKRESSGIYHQFFLDAEAAKGQAAIRKLVRVDKAGSDGDWRADAWWLERNYPNDYGKNVTEVTGKDGAAIPITIIEAVRPVAPTLVEDGG